jgi:hypothetical protein
MPQIQGSPRRGVQLSASLLPILTFLGNPHSTLQVFLFFSYMTCIKSVLELLNRLYGSESILRVSISDETFCLTRSRKVNQATVLKTVCYWSLPLAKGVHSTTSQPIFQVILLSTNGFCRLCYRLRAALLC